MQKYRIVPRQDNLLWELVQGMKLEPEEKDLLKISSCTNSWEIALVSQLLIPERLLSRAAEHIAQKCQLQEVVFYQEVVNLEDALQKVWPKLVTMAAEGNATVFQLLKRSKYTVDGSRLVLDVPGSLAGEILRAHSVLQMMGKAIKKVLGFSCHVTYNASEEMLADIEVDCAFNTPDYARAVKNEASLKIRYQIDCEIHCIRQYGQSQECCEGVVLAVSVRKGCQAMSIYSWPGDFFAQIHIRP